MTTRVNSLITSRRVLNDVQVASMKLSKTQQMLSSGKQLNRVSDDPYAVGRALQLRDEMEHTQQLQKNVEDGMGWSETTDDALDSISSAVARIRDLVIQGATDTAGGSPRDRIATEVSGLIDSIKTAANVKYAGRYIFSGTDTNVEPFNVGGSDAYNAANSDGILREIGPGVTVQINVGGDKVLGDGTTGLMATLRGVLTDLQNDDGPALRAKVAELDDGMDGLNAVRAEVGATYNRLESASDRLAQFEGTTLKMLSETEDVDMGKAMIDFSIQQAALQAGLQAGSKIVQNSLLDFLR